MQKQPHAPLMQSQAMSPSYRVWKSAARSSETTPSLQPTSSASFPLNQDASSTCPEKGGGEAKCLRNAAS